jgi:hypothetical protein
VLPGKQEDLMEKYTLRYEVPVPLTLLTGAKVIEMQAVQVSSREKNDQAASQWARRYLRMRGIKRNRARFVSLSHVQERERVVLPAPM